MALQMKHLTAMVLVGDGLLTMAAPKRDARAWRMGPEPFRTLMSVMASRREWTRWVGAAEVALGVWLALRDEPVKLRAT